MSILDRIAAWWKCRQRSKKIRAWKLRYAQYVFNHSKPHGDTAESIAEYWNFCISDVADEGWRQTLHLLDNDVEATLRSLPQDAAKEELETWDR